MRTKDKKRWILVGLICLSMWLLCGCMGLHLPMEIRTSLELNTSFRGRRVMSVTVSESVFDQAFHGNIKELQDLVTEKCPATMLCSAEETEEGVCITMTLEFVNYKDYVNKIGLILGKTPGIYYDASNSVFKNGFMLQENFSSADLFGWLVDALKESYTKLEKYELKDLFRCGTTMVQYDGRTFETSDQIEVEDMDSHAFKRISSEITMNEDGSYKAELNFIVDQDTYYAMGESMDEAVRNMVPDGGIYEVTMVDTERVYTMAFSALNEPSLVSQLNVALSTNKCKFNVESEGDSEDPFRAFKEVVLYLDASYFLDFTEEDTEMIYKLNVDPAYSLDRCESVTGFLRDSSTNTDGKYTSIYLTVGPSDEVRIRLNYAVEMQKIDVHTKIVNERLFERSFHFVFNTAQAALVGDTFEERLTGRMDDAMTLKVTDSQGYKSYTVSFQAKSLEELSKKTTQFLDGTVSDDASTFTSVISGGKESKKTLTSKTYIYEDCINFEIFMGSARLNEGIHYSMEFPRGYTAVFESGACSNVREENNEVKCTAKDKVVTVTTCGSSSNMVGLTQLILWGGSLVLTVFSLFFNVRHIVGYLRKKEKYLNQVDLFKGSNIVFMTIGIIALVVFVFTTFRMIFRIY